MNGTDDRPLDPALLVTIWRLETMSARLLSFAHRSDVGLAEVSRAFEMRSTLDGHLLAVRVLCASGASADSVANVIARASEVFDRAMALTSNDVVRHDPS
jgi:hypothetical protein